MLSAFRVVFALMGLAKSIDIVFRSSGEMGPALSAVVVTVWLTASVLLLIDHHARPAAAAIATCALAMPLATGFAVWNQHLGLFIAIGLILAVCRPAEQVLLLKTQLSAVYAFASLAKVNESFLSGFVLYEDAASRPFWEAVLPDPTFGLLFAMSIATVVTEAFLAVAFWRPRLRWVGLAIGVPFQAALLLFMPSNVVHIDRLLVFGGLMCALYMPFFERELDELSRRYARRLESNFLTRGLRVTPQ